MIRCAVLGRNGFIGSALAKRFDEVYSYPRPDLDYIFWFAAPSSQILFNYASHYCQAETLQGFKNILDFCKEYNIKLIYPSTASHGNEYAKTKATLEVIKQDSKYKNVLGLRISAGYGPGEEHKGSYASIIYQFCKQMKHGRQPVIYGDGEQKRDFVYIDDIVDAIIANMDKQDIIDIGTGVETSFNDVVKIINQELHEKINPLYTQSPVQYVKRAFVNSPVPVRYTVREGIKEVLACL